MTRQRRGLITLTIGATAIAAAAVALARARIVPSGGAQIPTARVRKGAVQVKVHATCELRAARATQLVVPPMGGSAQIVLLATSGQWVNAGEPVVEFDPADQMFQLEQSRFDLAQAEQEIVKADAQAAVQAADDDVALLHARFEVRRAELSVSGNEFISAVEAKKNELLLAEARQQLAQIEKDVQSHRETNRASTNVLREKRNKAQLSVQVAQRNIDNLIITAPFDGFVVVRENPQAFGGPIFFGMPLPEFHAGDSVFPGATIVDVVDTSRIEVGAKVPEGDRANVNAGQPTEVTVDAVPGTTLKGSVRAVSSVPSRQGPFGDALKQYDVVFDILGINPRIRPGVSAQIAIAGAMLNDALYIPRQAVFESGGRTFVYVRRGAGFDARDVKVTTRTGSVAVVENLEPGIEIALVDPRAPAGARPKPASPPAGQRAAR
jgi:HlyD family secretion protein